MNNGGRRRAKKSAGDVQGCMVVYMRKIAWSAPSTALEHASCACHNHLAVGKSSETI